MDREPSLEEIIAEFGKATAERWCQAGYRKWKKAKERKPRPKERTELDRFLKGATEEDLDGVRQEVLREVRE